MSGPLSPPAHLHFLSSRTTASMRKPPSRLLWPCLSLRTEGAAQPPGPNLPPRGTGPCLLSVAQCLHLNAPCGPGGPPSFQKERRYSDCQAGRDHCPLSIRGWLPVLLVKCGWFLRCFRPSRQPSQGRPVGTESSQLSASLKAMVSSPCGGGAPATPGRPPASGSTSPVHLVLAL